MTADEYDTGEGISPTARPGDAGGNTEAVRPTHRDDDRIRATTDDGSDRTPRTAVKTARDTDFEELFYV